MQTNGAMRRSAASFLLSCLVACACGRTELDSDASRAVGGQSVLAGGTTHVADGTTYSAGDSWATGGTTYNTGGTALEVRRKAPVV